MPSKPATVREYLAQLPEDRRQVLEAIRKVVCKNIDKKFEEGIQYGMMGYYLPHSVYPDGYHCDSKQPLPFAAFASQKNHIGLYLFCVYVNEDVKDWFCAEWKKTGKKLDMGKSCVRVKNLDGVALEVLGKLFKRIKAKDFVASYEASLGGSKSAKKKTAKKTKAKSKR